MASAEVFHRTSRKRNIVGSIDGCHIRIKKPAKNVVDYLNRKDYFSICICDDIGTFLDVYIDDSGWVHDTRVMLVSFVINWQQKMGDYQLGGDAACLRQDFAIHFYRIKR